MSIFDISVPGAGLSTATVPLYALTFKGYVPTKTNPNPAKQIRDKINSIYSQYHGYIDQAVRLTNVPKELLMGIIFAESGGVPNQTVPPVNATGLMQLTPATADGMIFIEKQKGRLSNEETAILRKYLGTRLDGILQQKYLSQRIPANRNTGRVFTTADLKHPELNLLVGAITVGLMIDEYTEAGVVRLDKVHLRYNQGWFYKVVSGTPQQVLAQAKKRGAEAYNNLLKHLGVNGTMHAQLIG